MSPTIVGLNAFQRTARLDRSTNGRPDLDGRSPTDASVANVSRCSPSATPFDPSAVRTVELAVRRIIRAATFLLISLALHALALAVAERAYAPYRVPATDAYVHSSSADGTIAPRSTPSLSAPGQG